MLTEHELDQLYAWVDGIPLTRPKKHMARDFSDGLLIAEIIHHFQPKLIDLHNFFDANSVQAKLKQWKLLETKAFKKLDLHVTKQDIDNMSKAKLETIEKLLYNLMTKLDKIDSFEEVLQQDTQVEPTPDKDKVIQEQQMIIEALELTVKKQEILLDLKNKKIDSLMKN